MELNPQILGRAENAHRALLERVLAGTGVSYGGWIALSLAAGGNDPSREQLLERMSGALKVDRGSAQQILARLAAAKLPEPMPDDDSPARLSGTGQELYRQARAEIAESIGRVYSDIPPKDLETAGRVLIALTARAESELSA